MDRNIRAMGEPSGPRRLREPLKHALTSTSPRLSQSERSTSQHHLSLSEPYRLNAEALTRLTKTSTASTTGPHTALIAKWAATIRSHNIC